MTNFTIIIYFNFLEMYIFIVMLNVSFPLFLLNFLGCNSFRLHIEIVSKNVIGIAANVQQANCFYRVRIRDLTEIQWGFQETLTGYGIWLLLGKRDSPKFGHGYRIGKENDIRDFVDRGTGRGILMCRNGNACGIRIPVPDLHPVVRRPISANLMLNFNPGSFFSIIFRAFN